MENTIINENINFYAEDVPFEPQQPENIKNWLKKVAQQEGNGINALSFIFCSDDYLHKMNVEYLNHDTLTDVITFQYSDPEANAIEGDIFISTQRITENAQSFGVEFNTELHRVMVHGTLHLLGYADKSPEDKTLMTEKENFYLEQLKI